MSAEKDVSPERREADMHLRSTHRFLTPAQEIQMAIHSHVQVAIWAAADRAVDPDSHPCLPPNLDGNYWTRRILADLAAMGLTPEGWEDAYMGRPADDEGARP